MEIEERQTIVLLSPERFVQSSFVASISPSSLLLLLNIHCWRFANKEAPTIHFLAVVFVAMCVQNFLFHGLILDCSKAIFRERAAPF